MFCIKTIGLAKLLDGVLKSSGVRPAACGVARRGIGRAMFRVKTIGLAELLDGVLKWSGVWHAASRTNTAVAAEESRSQRARRCSAFFAIVDDLAGAAR
jgi:hypothetical protein